MDRFNMYELLGENNAVAHEDGEEARPVYDINLACDIKDLYLHGAIKLDFAELPVTVQDAFVEGEEIVKHWQEARKSNDYVFIKFETETSDDRRIDFYIVR